MTMQMMSVFDVAAGLYARPIFVASVAAGCRLFGDEVRREASDNQLNAHPADFQLFHLGSFDDATGEFTLTAPHRVATGVDFTTPTEGNL